MDPIDNKASFRTGRLTFGDKKIRDSINLIKIESIPLLDSILSSFFCHNQEVSSWDQKCYYCTNRDFFNVCKIPSLRIKPHFSFSKTSLLHYVRHISIVGGLVKWNVEKINKEHSENGHKIELWTLESV